MVVDEVGHSHTTERVSRVPGGWLDIKSSGHITNVLVLS